jgi:hypothetical protein
MSSLSASWQRIYSTLTVDKSSNHTQSVNRPTSNSSATTSFWSTTTQFSNFISSLMWSSYKDTRYIASDRTPWKTPSYPIVVDADYIENTASSIVAWRRLHRRHLFWCIVVLSSNGSIRQNIYKFVCSLTRKDDHPVDAVQGNSRCFIWVSYGARKYTVWAECRVLVCYCRWQNCAALNEVCHEFSYNFTYLRFCNLVLMLSRFWLCGHMQETPQWLIRAGIRMTVNWFNCWVSLSGKFECGCEQVNVKGSHP